MPKEKHQFGNDTQGDGNRKGRVRVAMSTLVSLDVYFAVAGEKEHVSLLQVSVAVR